jgi:hypothetical protein
VKKLNRVCLFVMIILMAFFAVVIMNPQAAEALTAKEKAIEDVRDAIRALPDYEYITAADRDAVLKAQRLFEQAVAKYGVTEYDICVLSAKLGAAVAKVNAMAPVPLPPTGGLSPLIPLGLLSLMAGTAILLPRRRQQKSDK